MHGPLGEIVAALAPQTEADPVGILASLLTGCGNMLGRTPTLQIAGSQHHPRFFALMIGPTASRKGTAQDVADAVLECVSPQWRRERRATGLSSGEGLIAAVRDQVLGREPIREGRHKVITGYQDVVLDPGVEDKRLLVVEEEFARPLRAMQREGNTLSETLRAVWDGKPLGTLTKEARRATEHHISVVAHITPVDLRKYLGSADLANGMANRFLFFAVRRTQLLSRAAALDAGQVSYLGGLLAGIIEDARRREGWLLDFDERAYALWDKAYPWLSRQREGVLGGILSRAESQVRRLALLYAALDLADAIGIEHLRAALAVWRYCEATVTCFFGAGTGDPVQDAILGLLAERARSQTEISNHFSRKVENLAATLELMEEDGLIRLTQVPTRGRSRNVWMLVRPGEESEEGR
jgi:hypothetical protein